MSKTPIDGEFGFDYQLFIMRKMVQQLPPPTNTMMEEQLDSIISAFKNRNKIIHEITMPNIEDLRLAIKNLEFDLIATRQERDTLQKRLDDLS